MNQDELRRRYNAAIQANPSLRGAVTPEAARRQQGLDLPKLKTPKSNPLEAFVDGAANFGKDVVSSVQQAGGNVADIGVQGNALKDYALNTLNPFIDQQTRQKNEQDIAARSEAQRAVYHNMTDVSGNKLIGSSDVDEAGGRIAAGRGTLQDYAAVAGKGLQTGLDATMFFNPARAGAKAIIQNPGAKEVAKDLIVSSGAIGGTQGAATGAQVYGQTGDAGQAAAEGAKSAAATTLLQSLLGGAAHGIGTLVNKVQGPARTIARSKDPAVIEKTLNELSPGIDEASRKILSQELSQIKDKRVVQSILEDLSRSQEEVPVAKAIERGIADEALPAPEQAPVIDNGTALSRKQAAEEAAQKIADEAAAAKQAQTDEVLASAKDPNSIDYPTFQAQKDFENFANQRFEELNKLINEHPEMTPQQIEAAKLQAQDEIKATYDQMQAARQKSLEADQATPQAAPNDASVEEAAKLQSGTAPAQVAGDGSTVSNAPQGDLPDQVGVDTAKASKASETPQDAPADGNSAPTTKDEAWDAETQRHIDQLNENKGKLKDQDKARKQETGARAAAGEAAYKAAGGGEAGMRAKMAAQKGEKTKANIEPVQASDEYKNTILNDIEGSDKQFWEKTNTQNAFRKMWGDLDKPMQNHDIKKIQDYYNSKKEGLGDDVAELLHENKGTQEDFNLIEQIAGAPRTAMTIADFSAPRQMAVAFARHPLVTSRNYLKSFAQTFSQKKFEASTDEMANAVDQNGRNYSEFMDSVMNLHLPNVAEKASEEAMSSAQLLTKVPFYGRVVDASNRGMSSALAHTRFELAKNFIDAAGGIDNVTKTFSTKELADLGEVLNTITGRGGKKGGFVDRNAGVLSNTLFSGRLWASRLNMLNPVWYTRLSAPARKEALSSLVAFSALLGGTLTAIAATGVEVGADPRSADFGKVKIGNTRYDISGGFVQYPRLLSQILTGQKVSSTSGAERDVTAGEILGGFAEGKLNPLLAFAWTVANTLPGDDGNPLVRKDNFGEDVNIAQKGAEMSMPLNVSGMIETSNDVGDPILGVLMNIPSFFGAGVQTYGTTPSNLAGQTASATGLDVEKEVAKREADATKRKEQYKKTLSKEDKQLIGKSETELNRLKKDGIIDQNKVDDILRKNKTLESVGKNNQYDVPEGITTDLSKQVYQKFNSMAKKDQDYWLSDKNPPEEFAKEITKKMNDERVAGLSEFKPSNALAKLYADYEKDLATTKDLSEIDKVNKWKTFQSSAAKLNLSAGAKDVYTEGSSGDLKKLIESKSISDKDLQDAIQLDNELYSSGLSGSLKFSKKFRNTYGFGIPSGPDDGGSGGSGKSKSAHLDAFIPNSKMGNTGTSGLPRVSAKARTTAKIGAKSLPKASNNVKKISINL